MSIKVVKYETDVLVIGGGTAGCYAAKTIGKGSDLRVIVAEKSFIKRSGCLAAGVNALNAFIGPDETEEGYLEYVKKEFDDIVREDLVFSIAKRLNKVALDLERMGLPILKNADGTYAMRGKRSVKINGENIKPILAKSIRRFKKIKVVEQIYIADLVKVNGKIIGAIGFSTVENKLYKIRAKAVISTTGGASGIYKPNNGGSSAHKMWYSPFNCGSGYAQGIRVGAEMTTFEMRFIALRCKDTIAPTGTIAQSLHTNQVNSLGQSYLDKYEKPTTITRLYATQVENKEGRGPCYLQTKGIDQETEQELFKAYLNMAPSQTLKWLDLNQKPSTHNVEVAGTEPYIVGGHTGSGYWVDTQRRTTIEGLYAAGDVCGGSPKKYVTGCLAEAEIAAETVIKDWQKLCNKEQQVDEENKVIDEREMGISIEGLRKQMGILGEETDKDDELILKEKDTEIMKFYKSEVRRERDTKLVEEMDSIEEKMQSTMDVYAGGISTNYEYSKKLLEVAGRQIEALLAQTLNLKVKNTKNLSFLYEIIDRLYVAKVLIPHLEARKETRWKCYQSNKDYPEKSENYKYYLNSIFNNHEVHIQTRPIVKKEVNYEHSHK